MIGAPDSTSMETDWEDIQPPESTITDDGEDDVVVVARETDFLDSPISPPSNHELSPLPQSSNENHHLEPPEITASHHSSTASYSPPLPAEEGSPGIGERVRWITSSGIIRVVRGNGLRIGVWSFAAALAVAALGFYTRRWRRRRRVDEESKGHLMALIRQKDQKINQLLAEIARMNYLLSAHRRVPVLRVVVDGSQVTGRRASRSLFIH